MIRVSNGIYNQNIENDAQRDSINTYVPQISNKS